MGGGEGKMFYTEEQRKPFLFFIPLKVQVSESDVQISFFPFKVKIPISEIESVEVVEKIPLWIGWGLRLRPRKLYFLTRHSDVVRIKKKNGFWREIFVSSENPQKLVEAIRSLLGN